MSEHAWLSRGGEAQHGVVCRRPAVRHVLGLAFPRTGVVGDLSVELERDFLRLAYAVRLLRTGGTDAVGYLAVLSLELRDAAQRLTSRYEAGDSVRVAFAGLLISDMSRLSEAADAVAAGGDPSLVTAVGREVALDVLRREIALREVGAVERTGVEPLPCGIEWDYRGQVTSPAPPLADESAVSRRPV